MGGVLILLALGIATLLQADLTNEYVWAVLLVTLDLAPLALSTITKTYQTIKRWTSRAGKTGLAIYYRRRRAIWISAISEPHLSQGLAIPFVKDFLVPLGIFLPWAIIVMVGASNAVNLTDGLDGLVIMPALIAAACLL